MTFPCRAREDRALTLLTFLKRRAALHRLISLRANGGSEEDIRKQQQSIYETVDDVRIHTGPMAKIMKGYK